MGEYDILMEGMQTSGGATPTQEEYYRSDKRPYIESLTPYDVAQGGLAVASIADPTMLSDVASAALYKLEGDDESAALVIAGSVGGLAAGAALAKLWRMRNAMKSKLIEKGVDPGAADFAANKTVLQGADAAGAPVDPAEWADLQRGPRGAPPPPGGALSESSLAVRDPVMVSRDSRGDWQTSFPDAAFADPDYKTHRQKLEALKRAARRAPESAGFDLVEAMERDEVLRSLGRVSPGQPGYSQDIYESARRVEPSPGDIRMDVPYEPPPFRVHRGVDDPLAPFEPSLRKPPRSRFESGASRAPGGDWPPGMEYEKFVHDPRSQYLQGSGGPSTEAVKPLGVGPTRADWPGPVTVASEQADEIARRLALVDRRRYLRDYGLSEEEAIKAAGELGGAGPFPTMERGGSQITSPPESTPTTLRVMEDPERYWKYERAKATERLNAHRARGADADPSVELDLMQDLDEINEALWELGPFYPYPNPSGPGR
jgi:hypothetical protein